MIKFDKNDFKNTLRKCNVEGLTRVTHMLFTNFMRMQTKCSNFSYVMLLDNEASFKNVFWTDVKAGI